MDHWRLKIGIVWSSGDERSHHQLCRPSSSSSSANHKEAKKKKMRRITVCVLADGCCCCYNCAGSGTCANYLAVEIVSFCVEGVVAMVITTAGDMFRPLSFFSFFFHNTRKKFGRRGDPILFDPTRNPTPVHSDRLPASSSFPQLRSLDFHGQFLSTEGTPVEEEEEEESRRRHLPCLKMGENNN